MVKGMTRRVVVVKSPNKKLFEEAVFFLSDDADRGVSSDQIVAEAQAIANDFTRGSFSARSFAWLRTALWAVLGALSASLVWAVVLFLI